MNLVVGYAVGLREEFDLCDCVCLVGLTIGLFAWCCYACKCLLWAVAAALLGWGWWEFCLG